MEPIVTSNPKVMHGTPCFAGTRVAVQTFFDHLEAGYTLDGFLEQFPTVRREQVVRLLALLREDVARLKEETSLSSDVMTSIAALQTKLKARRSAIERNLYRAEGSPEQTPPHPADELREDAIPLRDALAAAGFATPALDALIEEPASLVFQSLRDISDELEVITG